MLCDYFGNAGYPTEKISKNFSCLKCLVFNSLRQFAWRGLKKVLVHWQNLGKVSASAASKAHNTMTTAFRNFPLATLPETTPDSIGFFEAIALAGLEGQYVRIPASVQRRHFGNVPFGKLAVKVEGPTCTTLRSVAFGRDFDQQSAWWSQFDKCWFSSFDNRKLACFPR